MEKVKTHKSIHVCDLMADWRERELELIHLNPNHSIFEIWRDMTKDMRDALKTEEIDDLIVPAWLFEASAMPEYTYLLAYCRECGMKVIKE